MTELTVTLPDDLASKAKAAGLLPGGHPNSPTRGHLKLPHLSTASRG